MRPEWIFYLGQELPQVGDTFVVVRISDAIDLHWGPVKMVALEQIQPKREEAKDAPRDEESTK